MTTNIHSISLSKIVQIGWGHHVDFCVWKNRPILLAKGVGTNFSEILSKTPAFSFKKMHLKMSSAKWRLLCLGLNVLTTVWCTMQPWHELQCAHFKALNHTYSYKNRKINHCVFHNLFTASWSNPMTYRIQYETQFKPTVAKGRKHDIIFTNKLNKAISISENLFDSQTQWYV